MLDNSLAFVFPGQGSQSVGMLQALAHEHPEVQHTFKQASAQLGYDLWELTCNGSDEKLNQTEVTQPAMLAAGVATYRVWMKLSQVRPNWMAGHSLGEYSALVCAEAIDFEAAVPLVAERARLMQQAVPKGVGSMAALLGLEDSVVVEICRKISTETESVSAANFNAPGQVVIAGHTAAVAEAIEAAKAQGAKRAVLLPVSVPSHCSLMQEAALKFKEVLQKTPIKIPKIAVVHNVDVAVHSADEVIRNRLEQQLFSSVRWSDSIRFMHEQGVHTFIELGPGKVLSGLNKRIVKDIQSEAIYDLDSLNKVLELLK